MVVVIGGLLLVRPDALTASAAPAAPDGLTAIATSGSRIDLSWNDNSTDEKGFKLQRRISGGRWRAIWLPRNRTSFADTGLAAGTYCHRIRSYNAAGQSTYTVSSPSCVILGGGGFPPPPSGAPAAPASVTATEVSASRIDLSWTDGSGNEKGFKLQRQANGGRWQAIWLPRNATGFSDRGLADGQYCYRIRSYNSSGNSAYVLSQPACITSGTGGPPPSAPSAPSNFAASRVSASEIRLSWSDNSTGEKGLKMQRRTPGGAWQTVWIPKNATVFLDHGLVAATYCYRIRSYNTSGHSVYVFSSPNCVALGSSAGNLGVQQVVSGLAQPVFLTAPTGDDRLFIVEKGGTIRVFEGGAVRSIPFLDISGSIATNGARGLLGLAFAPDYSTSGLFYVNYSDPSGDSAVVRYRVSADRNRADASSAETLLVVAQPFRNHNDGTVAFGLDGYLYVGLGDGGSAGDPGNRAQNDATLLGKILRLDVSGGLGSGYSIPATNPYAGQALPLPEIWSKGWRNPYRFSFDRVFGDMYVGDVGQGSKEEINVEPFGAAGGRNYGWRLMEGSDCFNPSSNCDDGSLTPPVYEYDHTGGGCSVTGGNVYRGAIPEIYGHYFFADYCTRQVFSFVWSAGAGVATFVDRTAAISPVGGFGPIVGFGEDGFGELYIVTFGGTIYKLVSP